MPLGFKPPIACKQSRASRAPIGLVAPTFELGHVRSHGDTTAKACPQRILELNTGRMICVHKLSDSSASDTLNWSSCHSKASACHIDDDDDADGLGRTVRTDVLADNGMPFPFPRPRGGVRPPLARTRHCVLDPSTPAFHIQRPHRHLHPHPYMHLHPHPHPHPYAHRPHSSCCAAEQGMPLVSRRVQPSHLAS